MPRMCFIVLESQRNSRGYIPSAVTEGEPGHSPLIGRGEHSQPWFWGAPTEEGWVDAQRICAEENERLGLTPADVQTIVESSMVEQFKVDSADRRLQEILAQ